MVRKVTVEGIIDFARPEVVFDIVFGSDEFMKRYHKKINCDPHAEVSSWNKNHERDVKYIALSEAPKMIKKLIGESFPVEEAQKYVKNGDCYTITCLPKMDSPNGEHVLTYAETVLSPDESGGGCAITSYITLECKSGLWGLQGAVESFMESKARTGFDQLLMIAKSFCQEKLTMAEMDESDECFFDAQDVSGDHISSMDAQMQADYSTSINSIFHRFRAAFSSSTDSASALDSFFMRTVLREMSDIHISCDALKGHVEILNTKMLKMEGELTHVRRALERQNSAMLERKQLTLLGAGIAAGFGLGFMYFHMKRQT